MRLTMGLLALLPAVAAASPHDIVVGLDEKAVWGADGLPVNGAPGHDSVLVMDVSDPAHPRVRASLPLSNSVFGPPTNLQVTRDGRLALVADSIANTPKEAGGYTAGPASALHVIDLDANPPRLVETLAVARQPSGLSINAAGTLALVANRAAKSISVLSLDGTQVRVVGEVAMGEEVVTVAITPDGRRAFVAKPQSAKVAVLAIDGTAVTTDKAQDVPVGLGVYNVDVTPDGRFAIAANTGMSGNGSSKTLTVIDAAGPHPHAVDTVSVGDGPEGLAISPDGKWVAVPLLLGTTASQAAWSYTKGGAATLMALEANGHLRLVSTLPIGAIPEAVAWSPDSSTVYFSDYADRTLRVFAVRDGELVAVGAPVTLPGQPASMRGVAR